MSAEQGARRYPNSGEPDLRDLKGDLWRLESDCWIDTGVFERPYHIMPLPPPGEEPDPLAWSVERLANGRVLYKAGYVFDGSSIPLLGRWVDSRTSAWPGMVHDAEHEAFRAMERQLTEFDQAAELYGDMLYAFGAWWVTSRMCIAGLKLFGHPSASPDSGPEFPHRHVRAKAAA